MQLYPALLPQGDEAFQCEVCGERTAATKHLRLHRLPRVLLLHIKRFRCTGATREKITTNVTFPLRVGTSPVSRMLSFLGFLGCLGFCTRSCAALRKYAAASRLAWRGSVAATAQEPTVWQGSMPGSGFLTL